MMEMKSGLLSLRNWCLANSDIWSVLGGFVNLQKTAGRFCPRQAFGSNTACFAGPGKAMHWACSARTIGQHLVQKLLANDPKGFVTVIERFG